MGQHRLVSSHIPRAAATPAPANPLKLRLTGLALAALGGVFAYLDIYQPLQQARAHATEISYGVKGLFIAPSIIVLGLALAAFARLDAAIINERKRLNALGWIILIPAFGLSIGTYAWFEHALGLLGYNDS